MKKKDFRVQGDELLQDVRPLKSPTLQVIAERYPRLLPSEPYPICVGCPNACWLLLNRTQLQCWCQLMNLVCWSTDEKNPMILCDGIYSSEDEDDENSEESGD